MGLRPIFQTFILFFRAKKREKHNLQSNFKLVAKVTPAAKVTPVYGIKNLFESSTKSSVDKIFENHQLIMIKTYFNDSKFGYHILPSFISV